MINAFHPDYVKTYMPTFLDELRIQSRMTKAGQTMARYVEARRKVDPSHGTIHGISKPPKMIKMSILTKAEQSMTMEEIQNELATMLKPRTFRVYSRAGAK
jgi:hypothetical protein